MKMSTKNKAKRFKPVFTHFGNNGNEFGTVVSFNVIIMELNSAKRGISQHMGGLPINLLLHFCYLKTAIMMIWSIGK